MNRFDMVDYPPGINAEMEQRDLGDYVLYDDVEALVIKLKEYLSYPSEDGRTIRKALRKELAEMIEKG